MSTWLMTWTFVIVFAVMFNLCVCSSKASVLSVQADGSYPDPPRSYFLEALLGEAMFLGWQLFFIASRLCSLEAIKSSFWTSLEALLEDPRSASWKLFLEASSLSWFAIIYQHSVCVFILSFTKPIQSMHSSGLFFFLLLSLFACLCRWMHTCDTSSLNTGFEVLWKWLKAFTGFQGLSCKEGNDVFDIHLSITVSDWVPAFWGPPLLKKRPCIKQPLVSSL